MRPLIILAIALLISAPSTVQAQTKQYTSPVQAQTKQNPLGGIIQGFGQLAQQAQQRTAFENAYKSILNDPVVNLHGHPASCGRMADLLIAFGDLPPIDASQKTFAGEPLLSFDASTIGTVVATSDKCAGAAEPLATVQDPQLSRSGVELAHRMGSARNAARMLQVQYAQVVQAAGQAERAQAAREAAATAEQRRESAAAAERAAVEQRRQAEKAAIEQQRQAEIQQRAEAAQQQAEAAQHTYEANMAEWKSHYDQIKTLPWVSKLQAPVLGEGSDQTSHRENIIKSAMQVVGTQAWITLTKNNSDVRDFPIMLDSGPLAGHTLGSLMACVELTTGSSQIPDPARISDGKVTFNPPLLAKFGRYDVTVDGALGLGKKPYSWVMYLKKMDRYFYVDEVKENGTTLSGVPGIVMTAGVLLIGCPG